MAHIRDLSTHIWSHFPTSSDPEGTASRGSLPLSLKRNEMWSKGPSWLSASDSDWPAHNSALLEAEKLPDVNPELQPIYFSLLKRQD